MDPRSQMLVLTAIALREKAPDDETFRAAMGFVEEAAEQVLQEQNKDAAPQRRRVKSSPVAPSRFKRPAQG